MWNEEKKKSGGGNIIFESRVVAKAIMDDFLDSDGLNAPDYGIPETPDHHFLDHGAWSLDGGAGQMLSAHYPPPPPLLLGFVDEGIHGSSHSQSVVLAVEKTPTDGASSLLPSASSADDSATASSADPTSTGSVSVTAIASVDSPRPTRPEPLDMGRMELILVRYLDSIKDLPFGDRECKIFYLHARWYLELRCPRGFIPDSAKLSDVSFTLKEFSHKFGAKETTVDPSMFEIRKMENGILIVIIKATSEGNIGPFPYTSFNNPSSIRVFQFYASYGGAQIATCPFLCDGNRGTYFNGGPKEWTEQRRNDVINALRMVPINEVSALWKSLKEGRSISETTFLARQLHAIFKDKELNCIGEFAFLNYQFGESYNSAALRGTMVLSKFILGRSAAPPSDSNKMVIRAAVYVESVEYDGTSDKRDELLFCCCIADKEFRTKLLLENPKYKIGGRMPDPNQDHCFLTLGQIMQYKNDIEWLPPWTPPPPQEISDRRPTAGLNAVPSKAETITADGKRGTSTEVSAVAVDSVETMGQQLSKEFADFGNKSREQMKDLQGLVNRFFSLALAPTSHGGKKLRRPASDEEFESN